MIANRPHRWLVATIGVVTAACALVAAVATLVNLPTFDEPLYTELKAARPATLERNAYPIALGFLTANDVDPGVAGEEILKALHERYEARQPITIAPQDMRKLLGSTGDGEEWQSQFKSLDCNARVYLDCANRLIAEVSKADIKDRRLTVLFERFQTLVHQERFDEGQERDAYTPVAPYGSIRNIARIRLAASIGQDSNLDFLTKIADDLHFWRAMLRQGETLITKMVAIAGIQNTLDFLSALMRERVLTDGEVGIVLGFLEPLTTKESDISDAFVSEAQISVLTGTAPVAMDASLLNRWTLQRNATLNEYYLNAILPMRFRSKLSPGEFYRQKAYRPLGYSRREFPPSLFNWGGNRLSRNSGWDPQLFVARTHDQNGRILLVLLQAELEQNPGREVNALVAASSYRNPYTGEQMEYEPRLHTIGFRCLHTAYHPPASPDKCAVRIE
jgi:hypothetical protein